MKIVIIVAMLFMTIGCNVNTVYFSTMEEANEAFFDIDPNVKSKKLITDQRDPHFGDIQVRYDSGM